MIIKGCSRGSPKQLAYHLQRVDTNERVSILEIQHPVADLNDAFFCWQTLSEGSRGTKGLYHANIDPAAQYTLTPEQRLRAVDVLEQTLGFEGQPRVVVMHEKHGRAHLHVVWCRMDYETGTLRSDSQNYLKHEEASLRLEREFGHEIVPGKHAKRDREKQPEFPRQDYDFTEAQLAERSPLTVEDRKEEIRALHADSGNGQEFRKALEDAGYVLAQGERGYLVVDQAGIYSALSRNLQGMKKAQVDAFMADVPLDRLPTIEEAKALQEAKALSAQPGAPDAAPTKPEEMSLDERKAQITGIRKNCDDAQAFKNALEEAGYVLARGDNRGYVLVDGQAEIYSLSKHLTDIKGKEYKAFMASIDMAALPDVEQAKALQAERAVKAEKQTPDASKFLTSETKLEAVQPPPAPENQPRPINLETYSPANQPSKFLPPEIAAKVEVPKPADIPAPVVEQKPAEPPKAPAPVLAPPPPPVSAPKETVRREPLPTDPWMAQVGGVDKLSPAHLESAERSYEAWPLKEKYDFRNYVDYVQRQWEGKELPAAPPPAAPIPGTLKGFDYGAYSPSTKEPTPTPALQPPPSHPAPPQPKAPDLAPKPTWIKTPETLVPIPPKQPEANFDAYAPPSAPPSAPDVRDLTLKEIFKGLPPPPPKPEPPSIDPEIEKLKERILKRQKAEARAFAAQNAAEYAAAADAMKAANVNRMEDFDFRQREEALAEQRRLTPKPQKGIRAALKKFLNPEDEQAKAAERQEEFDLFRSQQAHDRRAFIKQLEQDKQEALQQLQAQHLAEQKRREKSYDGEVEQRLAERQKAIDRARKESEWAKDFEKEQEQRWDDPDVPRRGK